MVFHFLYHYKIERLLFIIVLCLFFGLEVNFDIDVRIFFGPEVKVNFITLFSILKFILR